ncbi:MAG: LCP family protein [Micrococcales bacterium]|nr:LCP family protein [Micrococcales bacterium]
MVGVLVLGASASAAVTHRLNANVTRVDVSALVGPRPAVANPDDPNAGRDLNILLMGSDDREGENAVIGGEEDGMRADTAIVMHISADRSRVEMVSIPRDSMVRIPQCQMTNGKTTKAQSDAMFNSAFAIGAIHGKDVASAAACAWRTVEENTGLRIDHFVVVDFAGFQKMVDAVGGVDICVEQDIRDTKNYTDLNLTAGMHRLDGVQALDYVRSRYTNVDNGSDTDRIKRQQQLMGALAQEVLSSNNLADAAELLRFTSAVTESLTMDSGMRMPEITGLAFAMRNISSADIVFTTIPWGPDPQNRNRVRWTSQANAVWDAMAADTPIMDVLNPTPSPVAVPSDDPAAPAPPEATPLPPGMTSVDQVQQDAQACRP